MATNTPNYNLSQIQLGDNPNTYFGERQRNNMSIIDNQMKTNADGITSGDQNLTNHINSTSAHPASHLDNDSQSVSGAKVSNALDSLSGRIDALDPATGNVNTTLGVYKRTDNSNTNDYAVTVSGVSLVNNLRLNLEVGNSNTGASTLNWNATGAKDIVWLSENTNYPVAVNMIDGITELQYLSSIDKWVVLSKSGLKPSTDITQTTSIDQVGAATFKDAVVNGIAPKFDIEGDTVVNSIANSSVTTSVTSDDSGTGIGVLPNGQWSLSTSYSASEQTFNIKNGEKWFLYCKVKQGNIFDFARLRYSDNSNDESGALTTKVEEVARIVTATKDGVANIKFSEGDAGTIERDYQTAINLTALGKQSLTQEEAFQRYGQQALIEGINSSNGEIVVTGKNQFDKNSDEVQLNTFIDTSGQPQPSGAGNAISGFIKVIQDEDYRISGSRSYARTAYYSSDDFSTFISEAIPRDELTIPNGVNYVNFTFFGSDIDDVQLELGSTATDYEPFTQSRYAYDGKSVPNVSDSINVLTGEKKNLVSNVFTFNGTETWVSYTSGVGANSDLSRAQINDIVDANNWDDTADSNNGILGFDGKGIYIGVSSTVNAIGRKIALTNNDFFVHVPTADLPSDDLAGFISYLGTSNLQVQIQLATPIIEQLESEQFKLDKGGTIEDTSAVQSSKVYQVNLNTETRDNNTAKAIPRLENDIENGLDNVATAKEDTGTANTITLTTDREPKRLEILAIVPNVTNTGACTIAVNDNDSVALEKVNASGADEALVAGDLVANKPAQIMNRVDKYILIN